MIRHEGRTPENGWPGGACLNLLSARSFGDIGEAGERIGLSTGGLVKVGFDVN